VPKRNRRRTIIAVTALTFGAAGFVSSGALTVGSQGSLGDNWIQIAGVEQSVTFSSLGQAGGEDSSGGEATGSEGTTDGDAGDDDGAIDDDGATGDETDGTDGTDAGAGDDTPVSTSVEVVVDPAAANGLNSGGPATWNGSLFETGYITGTPDGYLRGIRDDELNKNATTRIGTLRGSPPGTEVAFLVANVGPEDTTTTVPSVTVTMDLLDGADTMSTDQIRFPYRVLDTSENAVASGDNLAAANGIDLATGEIIEVVLVLDTTDGTSDLQRLSDIQFGATE